MRRRLLLTTVSAAAGVAVAGTLLVTVSTGEAVVSPLRVARPTAAQALPAFADCAQLGRWYAHQARPQVGAWGLSGPPVQYAAGATGEERSTAPSQPVSSSRTGTNVQESGVDESDVAKTDGRVVVRLVDDQLVVTDLAHGAPRELSRTRLPGGRLRAPELLLAGGRVTVVGEDQPLYVRPDQRDLGRTFAPTPQSPALVRVVTVDLGSGTSPRLVADHTMDGMLLSTREYADGTVRVVTTSSQPRLPFVRPGSDRTTPQAEAENRRIVDRTEPQSWLPRLDGRPLPCGTVRRPLQPAGLGTISVLTLPAGDGPVRTTAVAASGDLVYSSAHRLYVATTSALWRRPATTVHAFALDGPRTTYVASGRLPGPVRDRWSFSEHDGALRVVVGPPSQVVTPGAGTAAGSGSASPAPGSSLVVLEERDGRLLTVGRLDGLGRGEQVQAVRWLGDLAVVDTFRQTDPVHTVDLSDPAHPRLLGVLHLPGFSGYLHPVGRGLLLGLGRDATTTGQDLGAQAATFDVSGQGAARRVAVVRLGPDTDLTATWDPRAFTYLPQQRTALTVVTDLRTGRTRFLAVRVDRARLEVSGSWATSHSYAGDLRVLPLGGRRVALVDDAVRVVDVP